MKKTIAVILMTALIGAAFIAAPADAGRKRNRKVTGVYNGGAGVGTIYAINFGGAKFPTKSTERYVKVKLTDATGQPVGFSVGQDPDGDSSADILGKGCGKTKGSVPIQGGVDVIIFVGELEACGDPTIGTQGEIAAVFSNLP
ncbi:MAG: hypothetical protein QOH26_1410 [Actinomycetota bacterium]|jgi:hypothetical protein|nr:hypothetical protein [Actinomycetota bacterium]